MYYGQVGGLIVTSKHLQRLRALGVHKEVPQGARVHAKMDEIWMKFRMRSG